MKMKIDWDKVRFFKPSERWGSNHVSNEEALLRVDPILVYSLDELRRRAGRPIILSNAVRNDKGTHGKGLAADVVITGLDVIDQFLLAEKSGLFTGIGIYPFWNRPGLHLDVRPKSNKKSDPRWSRLSNGHYAGISSRLLRSI